MATNNRQLLHTQFLEICPNVYYQPSENVQLVYPCIIYELETRSAIHAEDERYLNYYKYTATVIDRDPDSLVSEEVHKLKWCTHKRRFVTDNLYHDVFSINL